MDETTYEDQPDPRLLAHSESATLRKAMRGRWDREEDGLEVVWR